MLTTKIVLQRLKAIDALRESADPWLLSQIKVTLAKTETKLIQDFKSVSLAQEKRISRVL